MADRAFRRHSAVEDREQNQSISQVPVQSHSWVKQPNARRFRFDCVKEDIRRVIGQEGRALTRLGIVLSRLGLHAVLLYRLSRWLLRYHMYPVSVLVSYFNSVLTGAQISPRAAIGKGLVLYHPQGTVISPTTVIGDYCTLANGNHIGQLHGGNDTPVIGDYFAAGSGAKMFGRIRIGNRVRVGPNAVVFRSLPDDVTVVATSSRIIFRTGSVSRAARRAAASSRDAIRQRLLHLLSATVDTSSIDSTSEAAVLLGERIDLDSLGMLSLIGAIEEEFDLTIPDEEIHVSDFLTVGSLVTFIEERLPPSFGSSASG